MRDLYIFDLDGTLALIEHRLHYIQEDSKDWAAFFKACVDDRLNVPVAKTLYALQSSGADVWIWSGRSDEVEQETTRWLRHHYIYANALRMRVAGNHEPDDKLKLRWLQELPEIHRTRLVAVFDDRQRLVDMYRANGVACFQVAPGNF